MNVWQFLDRTFGRVGRFFDDVSPIVPLILVIFALTMLDRCTKGGSSYSGCGFHLYIGPPDAGAGDGGH